LANGDFVENLCHHLQIGTGHGLVEAHQDFARFDVLAFGDVDGSDNAASRVLNLLDAAVYDDVTGRKDRAREIHRAAPDTQSAKQKGDNCNAE
jgi:hypothetical protein